MEEFISRQVAIQMIEDDLPEVVYYRKEDAIACLDCLPSANVVSKSDLDRLRAEHDALIRNYAKCMKDYAKEIFDEFNKRILTNTSDIAGVKHRIFNELRNKYVEGNIDEVEC